MSIGMRFRTRTTRLTDANPGLSGPLADAIGCEREPVAKWFFDFSPKSLLPSHLFAENHTAQTTALLRERMVRRDLWAKFGQPMHFLKLTFRDPAVEEEFVLDATRRNKRWVEYCVFARIVVSVLTLLYATLLDQDKSWKLFLAGSGCVNVLQYLQIQLDRQFVKDFFHRVIFFWVLLQAAIVVMYAVHKMEVCAHEDRDSSELVEMLGVLSALFLITYRMRFSHFLLLLGILYASYMCILIMFIWRYGIESDASETRCLPTARHFRYAVVVPGTMICINYALEILQRKDFIQVSMVWKESRRSNVLLNNILPETVIEQLKNNPGDAIAKPYPCVTVLFADVVSFTTMSAQVTPTQLVKLLNRMFLKFDDLAHACQVEKIKTIGDCYMAAAGVPKEDPDHAVTMARFGLQMLAAMAAGTFRNPATGEPIHVRAGIHSGPAVAGVLGYKKFAYDLWGDAVNTASRMESHGAPMRLHCSEDTYDLLKERFMCEARERMHVKGKGEMQTYFVIEEKPAGRTKSSTTVTVRSAEDIAATPSGTLIDGERRHTNHLMTSVMKKARTLSRTVSSMGVANETLEFAADCPDGSSKEDSSSNLELKVF